MCTSCLSGDRASKSSPISTTTCSLYRCSSAPGIKCRTHASNGFTFSEIFAVCPHLGCLSFGGSSAVNLHLPSQVSCDILCVLISKGDSYGLAVHHCSGIFVSDPTSSSEMASIGAVWPGFSSAQVCHSMCYPLALLNSPGIAVLLLEPLVHAPPCCALLH